MAQIPNLTEITHKDPKLGEALKQVQDVLNKPVVTDVNKKQASLPNKFGVDPTRPPG